MLKTENDEEWIRANQGHSVQVPDLELKEITDPTEFPIVLHGTYLKTWPLIKKEGLKKMGRNHIHFASGKFGEAKSGVRANTQILVYIDLPKAIQDGYRFFLSDNGVILCDGGKEGILPPKYITQVISTSTDQPLDLDSDLSELLNINEDQNKNQKQTKQGHTWPGRSSEEVFNRLKWDTDYDSNDCIIGYQDRFTGIQEIPLSSWEHRDVTADGKFLRAIIFFSRDKPDLTFFFFGLAFIPWHRVYYFKYNGKTIWDRDQKLDLVFGTEAPTQSPNNKNYKKKNNSSEKTQANKAPLDYIVVLDFE